MTCAVVVRQTCGIHVRQLLRGFDLQQIEQVWIAEPDVARKERKRCAEACLQTPEQFRGDAWSGTEIGVGERSDDPKKDRWSLFVQQASYQFVRDGDRTGSVHHNRDALADFDLGLFPCKPALEELIDGAGQRLLLEPRQSACIGK